LDFPLRTHRRLFIRPRTKYDSYGNPSRILDPLAVAPGGIRGFLEGHAREIAYDSRGSTPTQSPRPSISATARHRSSSRPAYDEGFGTVASRPPTSTATTAYGYDTFARLTGIVKPGDTPAYPTVEYDYALAVPFATTGVGPSTTSRPGNSTRRPGRVARETDHYFLSRQFVDGLGRKLMTKTEAEPAPTAAPPPGRGHRGDPVQRPPETGSPAQPLLLARVGGRGALDDQLAFESIESSGLEGQLPRSMGP
jgi:hypothetical protein